MKWWKGRRAKDLDTPRIAGWVQCPECGECPLLWGLLCDRCALTHCQHQETT